MIKLMSYKNQNGFHIIFFLIFHTNLKNATSRFNTNVSDNEYTVNVALHSYKISILWLKDTYWESLGKNID